MRRSSGRGRRAGRSTATPVGDALPFPRAFTVSMRRALRPLDRAFHRGLSLQFSKTVPFVAAAFHRAKRVICERGAARESSLGRVIALRPVAIRM